MPAEDVQFVPVKEPEHIAELANYADKIFHEYFSTMFAPDKVDYLCQYLLGTETLIRAIADEGYEYYFMDVDGQHVGFVAVQPRDGYLYLSKLYCEKAQRGHGYGRAGIEFAVERAREMGLGSIQLSCARENVSSLSLYDHMGFKKLRSEDNEIGEGIKMRDFVLELAV